MTYKINGIEMAQGEVLERAREIREKKSNSILLNAAAALTSGMVGTASAMAATIGTAATINGDPSLVAVGTGIVGTVVSIPVIVNAFKNIKKKDAELKEINAMIDEIEYEEHKEEGYNNVI